LGKQLTSGRAGRDHSAAGLYIVIKQLPEKDGELQYRIKHPAERHERIARESELSGSGCTAISQPLALPARYPCELIHPMRRPPC
jgi:hypothetical protein